MAQMKEQNKAPEKELNEMKISNQSGAEFKTPVIRKFQELPGYSGSMEKTQAEMKVTPCEMGKNPQGTNSGGDESEDQISDLKHKKEKSIQSEH